MSRSDQSVHMYTYIYSMFVYTWLFFGGVRGRVGGNRTSTCAVKRSQVLTAIQTKQHHNSALIPLTALTSLSIPSNDLIGLNKLDRAGGLRTRCFPMWCYIMSGLWPVHVRRWSRMFRETYGRRNTYPFCIWSFERIHVSDRVVLFFFAFAHMVLN